MRIALPFPRRRGGTPDSPPTARRKRPAALQIGLAVAGLALLLAVVLAIWRTRFSAGPAATIVVPITVGDLTVQVESSGTVRPARNVELPFQAGGQVEQVLVKPGDQVRAGQPLARLYDHNLQLQVRQAEADLKAAQARLNKARNGAATPLDLALAESKLQAAQAQLQKTRAGAGTAADIRQAQANLQAAQLRLDALKNPTPAKLSAARLDLSQARTVLAISRDSLSAAKTSAAQDLNRATQSLHQAQASYSTALQNWQYVQDSGRDPYSPTTTDSNGKAKPNKLNDAERQQYYEAFAQAEAALHSAESAVAQAQVNFDTVRQKEAAEVPQAEAAVVNAQQQLDALLHSDPASLAGAQAEAVAAQAQLDELRQGGTAADVSAAQAQVDQAIIDRERLSAPAAAADIAAAESAQISAQTQLDAANTKLAQATLAAPFAGTVAAVNITAGGVAGSDAAVTLVDLSALHEIADHAAGALQPALDAKRLELQIELPPELPDVWADPERVGQMLRNLLNNAILHTPEGGRIAISATTDDRRPTTDDDIHTPQSFVLRPSSFVTLRVSDSGPGIAPDHLANVFDTGAQCLRAGDRLAVSATGGAGLGLAIVKQLVEAHGGHVWAASTLGQGACFSFTLPAAPS